MRVIEFQPTIAGADFELSIDDHDSHRRSSETEAILRREGILAGRVCRSVRLRSSDDLSSLGAARSARRRAPRLRRGTAGSKAELPAPRRAAQPAPVTRPVTLAPKRVRGSSKPPPGFPMRGSSSPSGGGRHSTRAPCSMRPPASTASSPARASTSCFANGRRVDFWGAAFSGDASFPEPARAEELAEYCAGLGFNLTRLSLRTLGPDSLERLDRFAAAHRARDLPRVRLRARG